MVITVHLHTSLQLATATGRISQISLELPPEALVSDAVNALGITYPLEGLILVVNQKVVEPAAKLDEGDVLHLIPAMSGGSAAAPN